KYEYLSMTKLKYNQVYNTDQLLSALSYMERYLSSKKADGEEEEGRKTEQTVNSLEGRGIRFDALPDTAYPGMRVTTPSMLVRSNAIKYSSPESIQRLCRQNIVTGY